MKNLLYLLLLTLLASSCSTPFRQHQEPWPNVVVEKLGGDIQVSRKIAVVGFDEQGDLWDHNQLKSSMKMIDQVKKPLVLTFVHGWRHDARARDSDLKLFAKLVEDLDKQKIGGYSVRGLFIGWRGSSINEEGRSYAVPGAMLSFWDRKNATSQIAHIGLVSVLSKTSTLAWKKNGLAVTVGHSFGGRILENACGLAMAAQSGRSGEVTPLADLVVLINPASESLTTRKIKTALQSRKSKKPLFVAIGAKNDFATRNAWPWGYFFESKSKSRNYSYPNIPNFQESQSSYLKVTTTNDPRQFTHTLIKLEEDVDKISTDEIITENLGKMNGSNKRRIKIRTEGTDVVDEWVLRELDTTKVPNVKFVLDSDAYWVFQVDKQILSGHSGNREKKGVFTVGMVDLLTGILNQSNLANRNSETREFKPSNDEIEVVPVQAPNDALPEPTIMPE